MAVYCLAQVAPDKDLQQSFFYKDSIRAEQHAALTQVDFDDYYINLIESEKKSIHKAITMSLVSGAVTGFGTFITIIAFSSNNEKKDFTSIHQHTLQIAGIGLTAAGVFGLSYNLYTIIKGPQRHFRLERTAYGPRAETRLHRDHRTRHLFHSTAD